MTNQERFKKYKQEHCKYCKNRTKDLCDIRIFAIDRIVYTKCAFYEREEHEEIKKMKLTTWPKARKQ